MVQPKISIEEHRRWLRSSHLLEKINLNADSIIGKLSETLFGPSVDFFVGSSGWPNINAGPLISIGETTETKSLFGLGYESIISSRLAMARGKKFTSVYSPRISENIREIAMSTKPVDVEAHFSKKPSLELHFSPIVQPMGPSAPLRMLIEAENPRIPRKVYSLYEEKIKAVEAISELLSHGFDNYYITKIFSAGVLGEEKRLVPTRWSITASDDIIGKILIRKVKYYKENNEILVFSSYYLFNQFVVLLLPGRWEFENFEAWAPKTSWGLNPEQYTIIEEYEGWKGRWRYAEQAGGYYASRLAVLEYLERMKLQGRVVVFREVYEGFYLPVGVWQVRENVRNALKQKPKKFTTIGEALDEVKKYLRLPLKEYTRRSRVLGQAGLKDFL
ncbi:MAG: hypothetical protein ACPL06_02090 [Candidatus Anstonellales archaeon]